MAESVLMKDAYHILTGHTQMYAVDAQNAVSAHPNEWSYSPWTEDEAKAARQAEAERHARETEEAKAKGLPLPAPLPPEVEPTPEEQEAIDNYNREVAAARERLDARNEKLRLEREEAEQVRIDEALVASPPPRIDPTARRRPFGRPGEPTPAETKVMEKREADQRAKDEARRAEAERINREKANVDKLGKTAPAKPKVIE